MKQFMILAAILGGTLAHTARAEEAGNSASYFSSDYFTDASGGLTLTADMDQGLRSGNRFRMGVGWTDAKAPALDKGWLLKLGAATDPAAVWSYGLNLDYWRFPAADPAEGLSAAIGTGSIVYGGEQWVVALSPVLRTMQFSKTGYPQFLLSSAGMSVALNYYTSGHWSLGFGGEESRYFTDTPVAIVLILGEIRQTGSAPFVSSLVRSRYYLEAGYQFTKTAMTFGVERSDTLLSPPGRYDPSVYINTSTAMSKRWSVRTTLGTTKLDSTSWYASIGATYTR